MPRKFPLVANDCGPISERWQWCCNVGCGPCEAVLVEMRTYVCVTDGEVTDQRTEPALVSSCCGGEMFLWDKTQDVDGPTGYDGSLRHVG